MQSTVVDALPDTGIIVRSTGGTTSRTTGDWAATTATTVYTGVMHVRVPDSNEITMLFGDKETTTQRYVGVLPAITTGIVKDDQLTITISSATTLIGVPMRVTAVTSGSVNLGLHLALEVIE